jgi:nitrite reductase/ring-hydroxylating ferredoxin subunit
MSLSAQQTAPESGSRLCRLDAIGDGDCREIRCAVAGGSGDSSETVSLVVMRSGALAWAYRNVCPHFSLPLNSEPDRFLVIAERRVMCAYHCAIFRFEDGMCIEGPALGMALTPVAVRIVDGEVIVA